MTCLHGDAFDKMSLESRDSKIKFNSSQIFYQKNLLKKKACL